MPLVFSLFFHKMSLIDENPLTPRSIFIHTVRKSLKLSQKLSNSRPNRASVKFTDSLLRLEGRPAFRPDSGGQLMAVDMLLIDAKDSGEDIDIVVSSSQTNEEWELQSGDDMSGAGAVRRSHITRNNHITLLYKLSIT
ncbi:unnamed protein product [Brassica oleracea var. botrytis]|uniref:(rape) hypothetical protein n=1 Tax=Brassica napus TaxID=3708 RepID=A0A816KHA9_BRANA|nr:unnamed protein product [Brassica napus]